MLAKIYTLRINHKKKLIKMTLQEKSYEESYKEFNEVINSLEEMKNNLLKPDIYLIANILKNSVFSDIFPPDLNILAYNKRKIAGETHINPVANFIKNLEQYKDNKAKDNKDELLKNAQNVDNSIRTLCPNYNYQDSIYDLLNKDEIDKAIEILKNVINMTRKNLIILSLDGRDIGYLENHRGSDINDIKKNLLFMFLKLYCEDKGYDEKNYKYIQTLLYIFCYVKNNDLNKCIIENQGDVTVKDQIISKKVYFDSVYHDHIEKINNKIDEETLKKYKDLYENIKKESEHEESYSYININLPELKKIIEEGAKKANRKDLEKQGIYILWNKEISKIQEKRTEIFKKKLLFIAKEYKEGKINEPDYNVLIKKYEFIINNTFYKFIFNRLPYNIKYIINQPSQLNEGIINEISCYAEIINRNLSNKYYLTSISFEPEPPYDKKLKNGLIKGFKKGGMAPEFLCRILVLLDLTLFDVNCLFNPNNP